MRVAALDLGSNTSLLLIAEVNDGTIEQVLVDETTITKLGQGVHANRRFHPEALQRMRECLGRYGQIIREHNCQKTVAVATSAARDVQNGHELIEIAKLAGIPVHIIAGAREAELTFKGALSDRVSTAGVAVIDVGGGSTEIIAEQGGRILGQSLDVGSVRLTEMFVTVHPISQAELSAAAAHIKETFARAKLSLSDLRETVAVAGTPTTLAGLEQAIPFEESRINGFILYLDVIDKWIARLAALSVAEREGLVGMQPKRSDVIVAGAQILAGAIRELGQTKVTVSTRGVRYGVALSWQNF